METKVKSMQLLSNLGFSILMILILLGSGCTRNETTIFSFANYLEDSVTIDVYCGAENFQKDYKTTYGVAANEIVDLAKITSDESSGVEECQEIAGIDSVCVRVGQETKNVIIWRSNGEFTLTAGYEFAHNWYDCDYWYSSNIKDNTERITHAGRVCYILTK